MFHLALHFIAPLIIAFLFFKENWKISYLTMLGTMLVDLDHILATPIYDANRCSIGFHPLHQSWLIGIYLAMIFFSKTRLIGVGLTIHMVLDALNCF